jgi:hypothetical protein
MSQERIFYRLYQRDDGWHAEPVDGGDHRVFRQREEALSWCRAQAAKASASSAPEEGAYSEADAHLTE